MQSNLKHALLIHTVSFCMLLYFGIIYNKTNKSNENK